MGPPEGCGGRLGSLLHQGSQQGLSCALVAKVKILKEDWRQHPKSELYQRIIQIKDSTIRRKFGVSESHS